MSLAQQAHSDTARPVYAIEQIVAMLASRAASLAAELLPGGVREGHEWRCGSLAGERGSSMAVHLAGTKAGVWCDFASGEKGDVLDLVAQCLFRGHKGQALQWSRAWLGLSRADPEAFRSARRLVEIKRADEAKVREGVRTRARKIWLDAQPRIAGTPVEDYLAGRGIDLAALERQPRTLRFHPALHCQERGAALPAMVAAIAGPDGSIMACHRTWLEQAGPGDWRKARLLAPKKVLGGYRGGTIRLWRGASGKSLAAMPADEVIDVTEGIEDGLSVAMARPDCRVIAAVSVSNLAAIELPPQARRLCVWRQNDTAAAAIEAFDRAMDGLALRGLDVVLPAIPEGLKDVNDLLVSR